MICDGDTNVFEVLKEKRHLMQVGKEHGHIRPLIIFGGGLMKGVYGAGGALALEEGGYADVFTHVVGISSGGPVAAHFVAGSVAKGVTVLAENCCTREFANPWRFWNQIDTEYFMRIMCQDSNKKIAPEAVLAKPTKLYFGVSKYATGKPVLLEATTEDGLFAAIHASLTMQNVARHRTYIDGVHYADGGFTKPFILEEILNRLKEEVTHIVFVTNHDREFGTISVFEKFLNRTLFRLRLNGAQVEAINGRREERDKSLMSLWSSGVPAVVIWGDGSVKSMERNPARLTAALESSRIWWKGILSD